MPQEGQQVRFLLCAPALATQSGSNIFMFHGERYTALAVFSSLNALKDYTSDRTGKKVATVIFHYAEKIGSKHPHTFIGWMEVQPSPPPA